MSNPTWWEDLVLVILIALFIYCLIMVSGCQPALQSQAPTVTPPPVTLSQAVLEKNWTPLLTIGGVFTGILLCGLVNWKMGLSVLAASAGATVYATMLERFSWALGAMGLALTIFSIVLVLMKFRTIIHGFIDGFQAVKKTALISDYTNEVATRRCNKDLANWAMASKLPAEAEVLVKRRKKQLEKEKDNGRISGCN